MWVTTLLCAPEGLFLLPVASIFILPWQGGCIIMESQHLPPTEVTTTMARHFGPPPDSDEAVMISRFHARTTSTPRATLSALSWAADKAGMSYGRFLQTLGPAYAPTSSKSMKRMKV